MDDVEGDGAVAETPSGSASPPLALDSMATTLLDACCCCNEGWALALDIDAELVDPSLAGWMAFCPSAFHFCFKENMATWKLMRVEKKKRKERDIRERGCYMLFFKILGQLLVFMHHRIDLSQCDGFQ